MSEDNIIAIPLSDIEVDLDWNSRNRRWMRDSDGEPEEREDGGAVLTGTKGLQKTIKAKGQDTPVDVIKNRRFDLSCDGRAGVPPKPWFLVAGFRRFEAIRLIWEENKKDFPPNGTTTPVIQARIRTLSPFEARSLNMRENVSREQVSTSDLAWGLHQMQLAAHEEGRKITQAEIAESMNLSTPYVGRLLKIMNEVDPKLTNNWRNSLLPLSLNEMFLVSLKPLNEQSDFYKELIRLRIETPKSLGKPWTIHARKSAQRMGNMFGELEAQGYLRLTIKGGDPVLFSEHSIRAIVKIKSGRHPVSPRQLRGIAESATAAYKAAIERIEREEGI